MLKNKKTLVALIIMVMMVAFIPLNVVNAGVTDIPEGASTNSRTTLKKTETGTEEVSYDTNLEEYIASKKAEFLNSISPDNEPSYKDEWLALYVAENGVYKYPEYLQTVFTGVTVSDGGSGFVAVGDPDDLTNNGYIVSGSATYEYELRYKEITVTKAENPYDIKNVNITLTAPTVGDKVLPEGYTGTDTENIIDDGTMEPDNLPVATTSTKGVTVDSAYWITGTYTERPDDWDLLFFGTFEENNYYYADIDIYADDGYTLNSDLTIKVNGEAPAEVFAVYDGESTHFIAKIKAVKKVEDVTYEVIEGANQTVDIGKDEKLIFRSNIEYSDFLASGKVYVDDIEVANTNYTSKEGSTIITFNDAYTKALSIGEHTFKIAIANGEATTKFSITQSTEEVTTENKTTNGPATGDNITLSVVLFTITILGTCIMIKKRK